MKANVPHFQPSSSAKADDPVFQRRLRINREAAAYWIVRSSRTMTARYGEAKVTKPCVVPANAGTHNHRGLLEQKALGTLPKCEAAAYRSRRDDDISACYLAAFRKPALSRSWS
jgi:hypothetical protein